jgi:hypothetical protein
LNARCNGRLYSSGYGVPIPISFSAASMRSGGAILIASA